MAYRFVVFTLLLFLALSAPCGAMAESDRQQELRHLLKHDCGSCHGMTMKGGLGPSLTPDRLKQYSVEHLVMTILHGRPGTAMPPWQPFLTEAEAAWLAKGLKEGILP